MSHIHEKIDFTVSIFISQNRKVLFVFHKQLQRWLPIGGHIELEENPEEAAIREVKEESGLDVELVGERPPIQKESGFLPLLAPDYMDMHLIKEPHWHIGLIYFAKVKAGQVMLNSEEHQAIQWLDESEFDDQKWGLSVSLKFYAREAIRKVSKA
jgi:8-oxo-dGTP pyrophosphatase MutT (NUDIX family)